MRGVRRGIWLGVVLGLALGSLTAGAGERAEQQPDVLAPTLTVAVGAVEVRGDGESAWRPVAAGTRLGAGDAVRTGPRSRAEVVHPLGAIRLLENTVLRLPVEDDGRVAWVRRPELLAGRSLFDVVPDRAGGLLSLVRHHIRDLFEVVTPYVVVGVKGTRFSVAAGGERALVAVYRGTVVASDLARTPRDTVTLTWGQLALYERGRLTGVRSAELGDDWATWGRAATGTSKETAADLLRESRLLDGALPGGTLAGTLGGVTDTLSGAADSLTSGAGGTIGDGSLLEAGEGILRDATGTIGTVGGLTRP